MPQMAAPAAPAGAQAVAPTLQAAAASPLTSSSASSASASPSRQASSASLAASSSSSASAEAVAAASMAPVSIASLPSPVAMSSTMTPSSSASSITTSSSSSSTLTSAQSKHNVIVIKYANVSSSVDSQDGIGHHLVTYELVNQPLSVEVIESKFSNSIHSFDISRNQLATLPKDLLCPLSNEVKQLNISHNLLDNFDCLGLISQAGQLCLSELHTLDMSHNLIRHLPATGVATLQNLEALDLSHNQIESLDELSLSSLFKLLRLDLSHNKLQVLPMRVLHKSKSLQLLNLHHNHITTAISQQLLAHLVSLEQCNLSHNNISQVDGLAFADKPNLQRVDLRHNQLQALRPEALRVQVTQQRASTAPSTPSWRHRLQHNGQPSQSQLPPAASVLQQHHQQRLPEFMLANNPFQCDCQLEWLRNHRPGAAAATHLPGGASDEAAATSVIGGAREATQLARVADLEQVRCAPAMRRAPATSGRQSSVIQQQHAAGSRHRGPSHGQQAPGGEPATVSLLGADSTAFLCKYKSHCFALCQCCDFDACDCELICPAGCQCYYNLSWQTNIIDCSASNHTSVPDRIPMDVSGLYLDGNQIDSLKPSNLIARKLLKELYLNSTQLQYIANKTFNGLVELQSLYLQDNQLAKLHGYEFEPLFALRHLYLQSNKLDYINSQTFNYLRSLEVLDLSNNRLTSTQASMELFQSVSFNNIKLRQLSIAHNWWSCGCSSIDKFRAILRQKFLLNGSHGVQIVDKSQLRCYHNATTIGPHILAYEQQALVAPSANNNNRLAEYNQCSNLPDDPALLVQPNPNNPPWVAPTHELGADDRDRAQDTLPGDDDARLPNDVTQPPANELDSGHAYPHPPNQARPLDRDYLPGPMVVQPPASNNNDNSLGYPSAGYPMQSPANSNKLPPSTSSSSSSFGAGDNLLMLFSFCGLAVLIALAFALVNGKLRYQARRGAQKRRSGASSAASSGSSSSNTSVSGVSKRLHGHSHNHHHQQQHVPIIGHLLNGHAHHQHHPTMQSTTNHHYNSSSSHSNIYAALVSSSSGATPGSPNAGCQPNSSMIGAHQQANNNNATGKQPNNIYSGGSTKGTPGQPWAPQQQQGVYAQPSYGYGKTPDSAPFGGHTTNSLYAAYAYAGSASGYPAAGGRDAHQQQHGGVVGALGSRVRHLVSRIINKSLSSLSGHPYSAGDSSCSMSGSLEHHQGASYLGHKLSGAHFKSSSGGNASLGAANDNKIYDAFISYDKRDEHFVTQRISAQLEFGQPQYRLADRFRDLPLASAAYTAEAIASVIGCSQRTILVLSTNYVTNEWCKFELEAALNEMAADKSHRLIVVVAERKCLLEMPPEVRELLFVVNNNTIANNGNLNQQQQQLVHLDAPQQSTLSNQLIATLEGCQLAPQLMPNPRVDFVVFDQADQDERRFWHRLRQLMPPKQLVAARLHNHNHAHQHQHHTMLTLTTKN